MVFSSLLFLFRFLAPGVPSVLSDTAEGTKCGAFPLQFIFLCLGRTKICIFDAVFHHHGLLRWPANGSTRPRPEREAGRQRRAAFLTISVCGEP